MESSIRPKCTRTVYIVLAVLLGSLGVHNFLAGRIKFGAIQLALGTVGLLAFGIGPVVSWVWALVEAFTVKVDGNGVPFDTQVAVQIGEQYASPDSQREAA